MSKHRLKPLQQVDKQRDLGILVTRDLKWETHIASMAKKANSLIYMCQRVFKDHSVTMIQRLYKSYIRPKLEFAHSVWNPYFVGDIETMERIQRRVTRIPPDIRHLPYLERMKLFNITTLKERRLRGDLIETFKIVTNSYSCNINFYKTNANEHLRGHSRKLSKEKNNRLQRKNFITNRVVYAWNSLPEETVSADNVIVFKTRLDKDSSKIASQLVHYL